MPTFILAIRGTEASFEFSMYSKIRAVTSGQGAMTKAVPKLNTVLPDTLSPEWKITSLLRLRHKYSH